jgi:beta-glucosidase
MKKLTLLLFACFVVSCNNSETAKINNNPQEDAINQLLSKMTLEEKIGQTNLRGTSSRVKGPLSNELKEGVRKGEIGAFLNVMNTDYVDELQRIAVEESPNGIPLIFGRDVIHGFKTIFPIPLGLAASWDIETAKTSSEIAAFEASSVGIRWTFAPMLDIARDSRWGRIAESPGEDPYLASVLGKAYVEGFQGDLKNPTTMAACAKHFIAYGAAIGGRDYNTVDLSEQLLRNIYLPPFKAAIAADVASIMTGFNDVNGIPATGNEFILKTILRNQLNFTGFVVSDWNSAIEMIPHGYAKNEKQVAELAANAGMDMEMTSQAYEHHLKKLIEEGKITEQQLDEFVKNILRIKFKMGLFENPYRDKNHTGNFYAEKHLEAAKKAAIKSSVLLKNNNNILPLNKNTTIAVIGPLANAKREQLGTWCFDAEKEHTVTPIDAFMQNKVTYKFSEGLTHSRDVSTNGFNEAIKIAKTSDVIVFFGGEEAILSGEAHSRANINLPGAQEQLLNELAKTGKPIVLVIMAGRAITITNIINNVDAVLMAWHPGTMGGPALYDILFGNNEPEGRLPISWPKTAGQLPYFYNHKSTGRPADSTNFVHIDDIPIEAWQSSLGNNSHYLDAGFTPHFPFGYGLGYTTFKYENIQISKDTINSNEQLIVKANITNTGNRAGHETVQLYIQDVFGSITRPVKELKGFQHIYLKPNEQKEVAFTISPNDVTFVNAKMMDDFEEGDFNCWIGPNSASGLKTSFYITKK